MCNGIKIAEIKIFYIPEGLSIPNNYFELAFSDEVGESPSFPQKINDIKVGSLTGEVAKEEESYADDYNSIINQDFYVYYLTDGKTVVNVLFYIREDTKDYINENIMEKVINSVKFLD